MSASPIEHDAFADGQAPAANRNEKRLGLVAAAIVLVFGLSFAIGARTIPVADVASSLFTDNTSIDSETIWSRRLPRTLFGLMAGIAFALSGALMQALTRNPLADPGILGINAGAAFAMVAAIGLLGISHPLSLIWFAFAGTGLAAIGVYAAAMGGRVGATPLRLTLAGVAIGSVLRGLTSTLIFLDPNTFDHMLNWEVGSLAITGYDNLVYTALFVVIGVFLDPAGRARMTHAAGGGGCFVRRSARSRCAVFQSITRNPLGSPDVVGFDAGAYTGAILAITFAGGGWFVLAGSA